MIYADAGEQPTRNVPTSKAERAAFVLADDEILTLARWAVLIEDHYGCPMDMEWAKDGETGEMFIVQARPETVQSRRRGECVQVLSDQVDKGRQLVTGLAIGDAVVAGRVCLIEEPARHRPLRRRRDPRHPHDRPGLGADHEARRRDRHRPRRAHLARRHRQPRARAAGDRRHRQRHRGAAQRAGSDRVLRRRRRRASSTRARRRSKPRRSTWPTSADRRAPQVMLNLANPAAAFRWWRLPGRRCRPRAHGIRRQQPHPHPSDGAGPLRHAEGRGRQARDRRADRGLCRTRPSISSTGWRAAWRGSPLRAYPKPVIVRMSDFKTNEYAGLIGGAEFEPRKRTR